jgi:hypothetical protein
LQRLLFANSEGYEWHKCSLRVGEVRRATLGR